MFYFKTCLLSLPLLCFGMLQADKVSYQKVMKGLYNGAISAAALAGDQSDINLCRSFADYFFKEAGGSAVILPAVPALKKAAIATYFNTFAPLGFDPTNPDLTKMGSKPIAVGGGAIDAPWDSTEDAMPAWMKMERLFANDTKFVDTANTYWTNVDVNVRYPSNLKGKNWGYQSAQKSKTKKVDLTGTWNAAFA